MTAVSIRGLARLRRQLEARDLSRETKETLGREAEAIAQEAARGAPGRLGQTVEVRDTSQGSRIAIEVGTSHPAGWFIEHGTVHRAATPWLWPVFRVRLPRVKQRLRNTVVATFKRPRSAA